jgi:PAS domain S-box-containing protein
MGSDKLLAVSKLPKAAPPRVFRKVPLYLVMVVPLVIQVVGAVLAVGWLSYRNGQQAVNEVATQLRSESSSRIQQHLNDYLSTPLQLNQINADAFDLGVLDLKNFQTTGKYFWHQMRAFDVGYISYGTPSGDFIGVERLDNGNLLIVEKSAATGGKQYSFTTNSQGDRIQRTRVKPNYNPLAEAWYAEAVVVGKPTWSSIYQWDDKPSVLSIAASYPLYDARRRLIGVLSVDQILTQTNDFLSEIRVSQTGRTYILERSGNLVASSLTTEKPFRVTQGKATRLKAIDSQDLLIRGSAHHLTRRYGNLQQIQTTQQLDFRADGQRQFLLVMPWRVRYGLDWLIVVVVPESDFMEQIRQNTRNTVIACAIALALATLIGIPVSRWIARQILRLSQASEALADGQLHQTVQARGITELVTLAESFNRMAKQLRESFAALEQTNQHLEQKVEERTASLAAAEAEMRTLFLAMNDLVVVYNRRGVLQKVVSTHPKLFLSPTSGKIGKTVYDLLPQSQADLVLDAIQQALNDQKTVVVEYGLVCDQHKELWFSANVSPLSEEQVLFVARDISDRKHIEDARRRAAEQLAQNEQQLRKQNQVLLELAKSSLLNEGDLQAAAQELTEAAVRTLNTEQASVWLFNEAHTELACIDRYERSPHTHTQGTILTITEFPHYFRALEEEVTVTANHTPTNANPEALQTESSPDLIAASILDTPIRSGGKTLGVISLEQVGNPRRWSLEEQSFTRSLADLVALGVIAQDRQRAEAVIRESQKKYRDLVESANSIIVRMAPDGEITFLNTYGQQFFGYSESDIVGQSVFGTLTPQTETSEAELKAWIQFISQTPEHHQDIEAENVRSDGEKVWVKWSTKAIVNAAGAVVEILSVGFDISDRKRAEAALQEKEQYLRLILNNIPQQVFWKDTNLTFLGCNRNWAEAAQLDNPEAIIGKTDYDLLIDPQIADEFRAIDRQIIETNTPQLHIIAPKVRNYHPGKTTWLDISKIPIHDSQGNVIGILGVIDDITQRKAAEEALKAEQEKTELLLRNVLPEAIAQQLKQSLGQLQENHSRALIAKSFDEVTILFADIVNFTTISANINATDLVGLLNRVFMVFDELCELHGLEKIKTIGDAYMVVGGLPYHRPDHAAAIANIALDMQREIAQMQTYEGRNIEVRIGINTGAVIAGVIGKKKFAYDLWGDAVNTASRMESHGLPGKIQVTEVTYQRLHQHYVFEPRGAIEVKGKGTMQTYWLISKR